MKNINSGTDLRNAILQLEGKMTDEGQMLKEQFFLTIESMKPINLIKSTFKDAVSSREIKGDILTTSVGLTAGVITKLAFAGIMKSPLRKLIGNVLMFGITELVARNPETVKSLAKSLFDRIRSKSGEHVHKVHSKYLSE